MNTRPRLVIAALATLFAACTTQKAPDEADVALPTRLLIHATGTVDDGKATTLTGTIENPFDQPVHGVRYVVTIFRHGGSLRVLDVWQHEDPDTTIEPGKSVPLSLRIESQKMKQRSARFRIDAQPVKLGSKSMPPPVGWKN